MRIEFYMDKSGYFPRVIYMKLDNGEWTRFNKLSPEEIELIFAHLLKFDKARIALLHLSKFMPGNKKTILEQFILCNWTNIDNKMDISDKKLQVEHIPCPFKSNGKCPYRGKGIVCIKI